LSNARSVSGYYSHSADLLIWQRRMRARGWTAIRLTGHYDDSGMPTVVKQFQAEKRLATDGLVGPQTWAAAWTAPVT
jgi:peptidoglycan hydrolase-like protein with peptidoglycan-binding domain